MGRGSREQVVGLEEPISLESAGGVIRSKWVRRQRGGGVGRSREMGRGEAIECAGGLCTGNNEWLIAVILSAKNWRNELQRSGVEVERVLVRGLRRLLTVEKRVLGF